MTKVTLQEIARIYRKHPTTFLRYVRRMEIPHIKLGGTMLFDLERVDAFLEQRTQEQMTPESDISAERLQRKTKACPTPTSSRYSEMLGLEVVKG